MHRGPDQALGKALLMNRISLVASSLSIALPAAAGMVTVTGGGTTQTFSQVSDAMAWVTDPSRSSTQFHVHVASGSYASFDVATNVTMDWGASPGLLEMTGSSQRPVVIGGKLNFEIGGRNNAGVFDGVTPQYDTLAVDSASTIYSGDLQVTLLNGFVPVVGDSFQLVVTAGTLQWVGNLVAPSLGSGLQWQVDVGPNGAGTPFDEGQSLYLTLTVVPTPGAAWALMALAGCGRRRRP